MALPSISGGPMSAKSGSDLGGVLETAVTILGAGLVFLVVVGGLFLPTMGGRRSARLKWEARRQQVNAAIEADSAPVTK